MRKYPKERQINLSALMDPGADFTLVNNRTSFSRWDIKHTRFRLLMTTKHDDHTNKHMVSKTH